MTTVFIADTGVFVRCGGPDNEKFGRLRRALRQAGVSLRVPKQVYDELGGDPAAEAYPSGDIPYADGFEEGWLAVADELEYTDSLVSTVMDDARRFIANETGRDVDQIETADTALVGLAAQLLDTGDADSVVLLTTDKPAGRATETVLADRGFADGIEYRYASEQYLETLTPKEFQAGDSEPLDWFSAAQGSAGIRPGVGNYTYLAYRGTAQSRCNQPVRVSWIPDAVEGNNPRDGAGVISCP